MYQLLIWPTPDRNRASAMTENAEVDGTTYGGASERRGTSAVAEVTDTCDGPSGRSRSERWAFRLSEWWKLRIMLRMRVYMPRRSIVGSDTVHGVESPGAAGLERGGGAAGSVFIAWRGRKDREQLAARRIPAEDAARGRPQIAADCIDYSHRRVRTFLGWEVILIM